MSLSLHDMFGDFLQDERSVPRERALCGLIQAVRKGRRHFESLAVYWTVRLVPLSRA